jgi:transposase
VLDPELARRIRTAARKGGEWIDRRDRLIIEAIEAGASQREVAQHAGLSQPAVSGIWNRHREHGASHNPQRGV